MHLLPRLFSVLIIVLLNPACGVAETPKEHVELCNQARDGTLNVEAVNIGSKVHNAYLFNCSTLPNIGLPNQPKEKSDLEKKNKANIAKLLLDKGVDINYQNEQGGILLMATISSFFPADVKIEIVKNLIKNGVDWKHTNKFGKTALDLAKHRKDKVIIDYLQNL